MSTDYFVNGAYGILLSRYEAQLGDLPKRINAAAEAAMDEGGMPVDIRNDAVRRFVPALRKAFATLGIVVPPQARLLSTGDEDDRPGRCNVSYEEWVLGFGVFIRPDKYPQMHRSFVKAADHHTWVTCG